MIGGDVKASGFGYPHPQKARRVPEIETHLCLEGCSDHSETTGVVDLPQQGGCPPAKQGMRCSSESHSQRRPANTVREGLGNVRTHTHCNRPRADL